MGFNQGRRYTVCVFIGVLLLAVPVSASTQNSNGQDNPGKRLYRQGILPDGNTVSAVVQNDVRLSGSQVICVSCHRHSGMGSSEGQILVPPVTGDILYQPRVEKRRELYAKRAAGPGARPAYTDSSLKRAILEGLDPTGRKLNPLMPKYDLDAQAMDALIAYLKSLDSAVSPGITADTIHFATIVTPEVAAEHKATMLATLSAYFQDINANTRAETRRAAHSPWHKTWHYQSYKKWQLHIWELTGNSKSWKMQLGRLYADQPVFAVLNGISDKQWQPIHEFCEESEVPCVFPTTRLPVIHKQSFYSIYFSQGVALEAKALAKHIADAAGEKQLVQIYRATPVGESAASALRKALEQHNIHSLHDIRLSEKVGLSGVKLNDNFSSEKNLYLVLWLKPSDLEELNKQQLSSLNVVRQYVSGSFVGDDFSSAQASRFSDNVFLVRQTALPAELKRNMLRAKLWAKARKIEHADTEVMANAYFAATTTADVVRHLSGNLTREYFIEKIEHAVENTLFPSIYPHLSLGPGQRFAAKGCYVIGPLSAGSVNKVSESKAEWVVP